MSFKPHGELIPFVGTFRLRLGYVQDSNGRNVLACKCGRLWSGYHPPARTARCPDCGTRWRDLTHVDPKSIELKQDPHT